MNSQKRCRCLFGPWFEEVWMIQLAWISSSQHHKRLWIQVPTFYVWMYVCVSFTLKLAKVGTPLRSLEFAGRFSWQKHIARKKWVNNSYFVFCLAREACQCITVYMTRYFLSVFVNKSAAHERLLASAVS